ncbi:TauD/TfdA dioxygenase family protein [Rhizorhabdus histidinilytica]|uniref:TauD/TfdA dioxygenase family protein n=1 Tax=Rhizorhabdus histidinilytica TaxID=439228 RepID=UPI00321FD618
MVETETADIPTQATGKAAFRIAPLTTHVGAELLDIDLAQDQPEGTFEEMRRLLAHYGVLFFRDQQLTVEQYVALGRRFGTLEGNDTLEHVEGAPQVGLLIKERDHVTSIGDMWHTDHSYMASPAKATMLRAIEVPPHGGDTLFTHIGHSFATLPEGLKATLRTLGALHSRTHLIKDGKYAAQYFKERPSKTATDKLGATAVHPVVIPHPETGQEMLFVNPGYVVKFDGWTAKHSAGLLASLYDHCLQPDYQCRFRWREDSIAIWDNRSVWHYAVNDYHGHRRVMQRLVIS